MKHTPPRLLEQLAMAIRVRNYSYRTEQAYSMWAKQYIRFHNITHPAEMAEAELATFLNHLTLDRNVAPNTQNQALNALNFLYTHVLGKPLQPIPDVVRAKKSQKLPIVLDRQEIRDLFRELDPPYWLLTGLMYGSGLRLMEALCLPLTCWSAVQTFEQYRNRWVIQTFVPRRYTHMY